MALLAGGASSRRTRDPDTSSQGDGYELGLGENGMACHVANKLQGQVGRWDLLAQCNNNLDIF